MFVFEDESGRGSKFIFENVPNAFVTSRRIGAIATSYSAITHKINGLEKEEPLRSPFRFL